MSLKECDLRGERADAAAVPMNEQQRFALAVSLVIEGHTVMDESPRRGFVGTVRNGNAQCRSWSGRLRQTGGGARRQQRNDDRAGAREYSTHNPPLTLYSE